VDLLKVLLQSHPAFLLCVQLLTKFLEKDFRVNQPIAHKQVFRNCKRIHFVRVRLVEIRSVMPRSVSVVGLRVSSESDNFGGFPAAKRQAKGDFADFCFSC
jgi:hypothetical protein